MNYVRNEFMKYLFDEIKAKSFSSDSLIWREVELFSETTEFEKSFKQWFRLRKKPGLTKKGPKHIFS